MSFSPVIRWLVLLLWISGMVLVVGGCTLQRAVDGKWVIEEEEGEYAGLNVYNFKTNGEINIYEYDTKEATNWVRSEGIGTFVLVGSDILVSWRDGKVPLQRYRVRVASGSMVWQDLLGNSRNLRFIKTKQCN